MELWTIVVVVTLVITDVTKANARAYINGDWSDASGKMKEHY